MSWAHADSASLNIWIITPNTEQAGFTELLFLFFAGICSYAFHKQILLCTSLQFISTKVFVAVKFDCLKLCGKWQHNGANEMNQFIQSEEYLWSFLCLTHFSWRYLLHLCPKGVMRLHLLKACEVLWRRKRSNCCMLLFHSNGPLSFTVLSGISGRSARKPVPCISGSEGTVQ